MGGEREVVLGSYWSCWWPSGGSPGRLGLRHSPQGGHLAVLEALEAGTHVSLMTAMNTSRSAGRSRYGFVAQTARTDLTDLARRGYLDSSKQGRRVVWHPVGDLPARLGV